MGLPDLVKMPAARQSRVVEKRRLGRLCPSLDLSKLLESLGLPSGSPRISSLSSTNLMCTRIQPLTLTSSLERQRLKISLNRHRWRLHRNSRPLKFLSQLKWELLELLVPLPFPKKMKM